MRPRIYRGFSTAIFDIDQNVDVDFCGNFSTLMSIDSPYLAKYVEFTRLVSDPTKIAFTSEHPLGKPLSFYLPHLDLKEKCDIAYQILRAVSVLHEKHIPIGYISMQNVIVNCANGFHQACLVHYGSFFLMGGESLKNVYNMFTLTPERVLQLSMPSRNSDVFSLGILLLSLLLGFDFHNDYSFVRYWQSFTSFIIDVLHNDPDLSKSTSTSLFDKLSTSLANATGKLAIIDEKSPLYVTIDRMLLIAGQFRPPLKDLIDELDSVPLIITQSFEFPVDIRLHLWKLCGKSIERNLIDSKFIEVTSSIALLHTGHIASRYLNTSVDDGVILHNDYRIFVQPDDNYVEANRSAKEYLLNKCMIKHRSGMGEFERCRSQLTFNALFERFVAFYEDLFNSQKILNSDTPCSIRAKYWKKLTKKTMARYLFNISNSSLATACKHQLTLDLPRCHQYDDSMTSPYIHAKISFLIEKILAVTPNFSAYWQGLDSLIAPFTILYLNDLPSGFEVAYETINRFTPDYFTRHSSFALEESLRLFAKLITFSDATLSKFLRQNGVVPSTFAVPWLLTCYAHVFAFDKLFHIMDYMMNRDSVYPLCVGLAILKIHALELMDAIRGDEAFKVLSNISDVDVMDLLKIADSFCHSIPKSCFIRETVKKESTDRTVTYNSEEADDLFVPKIHDDDFYEWFVQDKALLVVGGEATATDKVLPIANDRDLSHAKATLRKASISEKIIGVISDDSKKAMIHANRIADMAINRVCVLQGQWKDFQWNHSL